MQEILPGVHHWTAVHPNIGLEVSSYWLADERVLINPLAPPEGLDPVAVVLTNRHHLRDAEQCGVPIHAPRPGLDDLPDGVQGYDDGDELPGGLIAHAMYPPWPDEFAVEIPRVRALALADGVVRFTPDAPLGFVPDQYLGDEAEEDKRGLRAAYGRAAEELDIDALLLAHGDPVISGGRDALRAFAAG